MEKHVEGLGFTLQDKGKKTCTILLSKKKDDYRLMLALAHYSLRLSSVFVTELCYAFVVTDHFKVKKNSQPMKVKDLNQMGVQLASILRNEHIFDDKAN